MERAGESLEGANAHALKKALSAVLRVFQIRKLMLRCNMVCDSLESTLR
jgi:hypothetical protein